MPRWTLASVIPLVLILSGCGSKPQVTPSAEVKGKVSLIAADLVTDQQPSAELAESLSLNGVAVHVGRPHVQAVAPNGGEGAGKPTPRS